MTNDVAKPEKSKRNGVSGRLKDALDDMIFNGTAWNDAAVKANITTRSMRMSMQKPHVLRYIRQQRGVALAQASSENFHRLRQLRDQDENRAAAVSAARTLETMIDAATGKPSGGAVGHAAGYIIDLSEPRAGLQIVVVQPEPKPALADEGPMIDITPNKASDD